MTEILIRPATAGRWPDLERLFGPSGATSGCWCMWWRTSAAVFKDEAGDRLKERLHALTAQAPRGLLAYQDDAPVGWVSLGQRGEFGRLNRSPKLKPIDDATGVWSVVCFFIHRDHRGRGIGRALLTEAIDVGRRSGALILEGYPIDTSSGKRSSADVFTGTLGLFTSLGFVEVERRGGRPIVRLDLEPSAEEGEG